MNPPAAPPMLRLIDRAEVAERLPMARAIAIVRGAMIALSNGETSQPLREIVPLGEGRLFGIMPGAMGGGATFGAKLLSIYPDNVAAGLQSHQGVVLLFEPGRGLPVAALHAGEITAIRTAAASAVATDVLARSDARRLAILGTGEQAASHAGAMALVRPLADVRIWGRDPVKAAALAARLAAALGLPVAAAPTVTAAVADADIICTVTGAEDPILLSDMVAPGTHINVVGSGHAGPREIDDALVVRARFIADYRPGVLAQGAEFLHARAAGLIGDDHVVGEIGAVLAGRLAGRTSDAEVTIYKSLGHVVQDLACGWALYADN